MANRLIYHGSLPLRQHVRGPSHLRGDTLTPDAAKDTSRITTPDVPGKRDMVEGMAQLSQSSNASFQLRHLPHRETPRFAHRPNRLKLPLDSLYQPHGTPDHPYGLVRGVLRPPRRGDSFRFYRRGAVGLFRIHSLLSPRQPEKALTAPAMSQVPCFKGRRQPRQVPPPFARSPLPVPGLPPATASGSVRAVRPSTPNRARPVPSGASE